MEVAADRPFCDVSECESKEVLFALPFRRCGGWFAQPWDFRLDYRFPPFGLLARVLQKIAKDQGALYYRSSSLAKRG